MAAFALRTPSLSIASVLSRKPAVSVRCTARPSRSIVISIRSRVVPGISLTIARSVRASAFSRLDLPALGAPATTTLAPRPSNAPGRALSRRLFRASRAKINRFVAWSCGNGSIGSSEKSIFASIYTLNSPICSDNTPICSEKSPVNERRAERAAACVWLSIRSATASAWARSSLPFKKARSVNSPGLASRAPKAVTLASS